MLVAVQCHPLCPTLGTTGLHPPHHRGAGLSWGELHRHWVLGLVVTQGFVQTLPDAGGGGAATAAGLDASRAPQQSPSGLLLQPSHQPHVWQRQSQGWIW